MTTREPLAPLTPHSEADNDTRLEDGWATWSGSADDLRGIWPGEKFTADDHSHFLPHGCEFAHRHRGGGTPHDHQPGDRRWAKVEKEDKAEEEARQ
jgi:hypothetical protein